MTRIGKLKRLIADLGWLDASIYALDRCGSAFTGAIGITRYILVAQPVPEKPLLPSGRGESLTVRPLSSSDDLGNETPLSPSVLASRERRGSICVGAFDGHRLIGFACAALGPHDDELVLARFTPLPHAKAAWDYDFYIAPRYRLGFAFPRIWDEMFTLLRDRGIAWTTSYITAYNITSLKSHLRLGAVPVGGFVVVKLGRSQAILQRRRPFARLATPSRARPEITVAVPGYRMAELDGRCA